jgi:hypothetical protein
MSIPEVPMSTTSENEVDYCNDEQIHVDEAWNQIGSRFSKYSENNFPTRVTGLDMMKTENSQRLFLLHTIA